MSGPLGTHGHPGRAVVPVVVLALLVIDVLVDGVGDRPVRAARLVLVDERHRLDRPGSSTSCA